MPKKAPAIIEEDGKHFDGDEPIIPSEPVPPKLRGFCRWFFGQSNACPNRSVAGSEWCEGHKCSDCKEHAAVALGRCVKCYAKAYRAS